MSDADRLTALEAANTELLRRLDAQVTAAAAPGAQAVQQVLHTLQPPIAVATEPSVLYDCQEVKCWLTCPYTNCLKLLSEEETRGPPLYNMMQNPTGDLGRAEKAQSLMQTHIRALHGTIIKKIVRAQDRPILKAGDTPGYYKEWCEEIALLRENSHWDGREAFLQIYACLNEDMKRTVKGNIDVAHASGDILLAKVAELYASSNSTITSRTLFMEMDHGQDESPTAYMNRLRVQAKDADFFVMHKGDKVDCTDLT